jgi:hypothetical protein
MKRLSSLKNTLNQLFLFMKYEKYHKPIQVNVAYAAQEALE